MGNCTCCSQYENGIIRNDSNLIIEYLVYGSYDQKISQSIHQNISGKLEYAQDKIKIPGYQQDRDSKIVPKYSQSFVQVLPGRTSFTSLSNLELGKYKITVRIRLNNIIKYLLKDVVIRSAEDMRLKIRQDGSVKNLNDKQALEMFNENQVKSPRHKHKINNQFYIIKEKPNLYQLSAKNQNLESQYQKKISLKKPILK